MVEKSCNHSWIAKSCQISLARLGNPELRDDCGITGQNISNQFASIAAEFSWYSIVIVGPFGIIALGILRSSQQ
jgi:hypothetical protein